MEYSYEDCLSECLSQVKKYHTARRSKQWDYWEFQEIRDDLSESLVYFGPVYADLRANAELAEVQRKQRFEERKLHHRSEAKGKKITASEIESLATTDIKTDMEKEVEAKREYYKARHLVERIDQVLNGIASRLKPLDKYDSKEDQEFAGGLPGRRSHSSKQTVQS